VVVKDRAAADHFYKDILGFQETWHGGMDDKSTDWVTCGFRTAQTAWSTC